jgi:hypothetical protein
VYICEDKDIDETTKIVLSRVCDIVNQTYTLPDEIQVEYKKLGENIYGETYLQDRFQNRICLNHNLEIHEIIKPFMHELLHLHQIHISLLSKRRDGSFLWNNRVYRVNKDMSYQQYMNLPWELDVAEKQQKLLKLLQENNSK